MTRKKERGECGGGEKDGKTERKRE